MKECSREDEVLDMLQSGGRRGMAMALVEHLESCQNCAELARVVRAFRQDCEQARDNARIPSAGVVWWRASIRARADATRVVDQPMTIAQAVSAVAVVALGSALAGLAWESFPPLPPLPISLLLVLAIAVCLLVAPLALVLALVRE